MEGIAGNYGADQVATSSKRPTPDELAHLISEAIFLVDAAGSLSVASADALRNLLRRLSERRFHLAILGQFKRGKSTLLNALLGEDVLPASVLPLTSIPTFVRSGDRPRARVCFNNGSGPDEISADDGDELRAFLGRYVTEEANPANRLGVSQVEVRHPAPILHEGVLLIDTPGIGSTYRHNTQATLNFIPQCDAVLFVVSPDPPVTEVEIEFLREVRARIDRVFFVLNKRDYLSDHEEYRILTFLRSVLREQAGLDGDMPILPVSARLGLEARRLGDTPGWAKSGMRDLETRLTEFFVEGIASALDEAIARKASDAVGGVLIQMRLYVKSLLMPIQDLSRRMDQLRTRLVEVEAQRIAEADLLAGDKKRMGALLDQQAQQVRMGARERLAQVACEALESRDLDFRAAQDALAEVIPGYFERELGGMSRSFDDQVRETFARHSEHVDALIESVYRTAAEIFNVPFRPRVGREPLAAKRQPYWVTHHWPVTLGLLPEGFFDRLLPHRIRKGRVLGRLRERIDLLVAENVENVRWPALQDLEQSFREFGSALEERMGEAVSATRAAIESAYDQRRHRAQAVESAAAQVDESIALLECMHDRLRACCGARGKGE